VLWFQALFDVSLIWEQGGWRAVIGLDFAFGFSCLIELLKPFV